MARQRGDLPSDILFLQVNLRLCFVNLEPIPWTFSELFVFFVTRIDEMLEVFQFILVELGGLIPE